MSKQDKLHKILVDNHSTDDIAIINTSGRALTGQDGNHQDTLTFLQVVDGNNSCIRVEVPVKALIAALKQVE